VLVGFFFFAALFFLFFFFVVLVDGAWPWLEGVWRDDDVGWGVVVDELVVVVLVVPECEGEVEVEVVVVVVVVVEDDALEDEAEDEELDEELDELGDVVVVVVMDEDDDEVVGVEQVMVSVAPGIPRSGMAPGVASTVCVFTMTPPTITVTVHGSAEATGMAARPRTTKIAAASSSTARSLRLNVKLVRPLLPPSTCASHACEFAAHRRAEGTLLTGTEVCNLEPGRSREVTRAVARAPASERRGATGALKPTHSPMSPAGRSSLTVKSR
jgi:hypothetical protein